jgi:uncharacterized protein DUF87
MKILTYLIMILLLASFCLSISTDQYIITPDNIDNEVQLEKHFKKEITVTNKGNSKLSLILSVEGNISKISTLDSWKMVVDEKGNSSFTINVFGEEEISLEETEEITYPRTYGGNIEIRGDLNEDIPLSIDVLDRSNKESGSLIIKLTPLSDEVIIGTDIKYVVDLKNVFNNRQFDMVLNHRLVKLNDKINRSGAITFKPEEINKSINLTVENMSLIKSFSITKEYPIEKDFEPGEYILLIEANYLGLSSKRVALIDFKLPVMKRKLFGWLPVWLVVLVTSTSIVGFIAFKIIKHEIDKKKRFKVKIDFKELPKEGPRNLFVGKIAETNKKAYFDMDVLTVHSIVAGSTGGGKSIAAQGIVEEVLIKGAAIVCFDPTAQWSGMLRKCIDKKMLSFYAAAGMKVKEARSFPGNIRAIKNGREIVDVYSYFKAGEIQVFTTSTLDPKEYDLFVATVIRTIFHSKLEEFRGLRFMLIFDEIHRILPKFGGSGQGFIQIERGCREFRKWGIGILLISQVLSDFVGQIKANINTNVQMKTRDEGDLGRIKTNYGEEFIQALIKAPVGSGMVQNSAYNRGNPYYITFRPILHSVVRLADEELDKYNKYNDIIDNLEYQFEQLEAEGQDVFDLKLELKLSKDKVKSGNFNMVQIYLDGLTPRIEKVWTKINKKPKKLERKLVTDEELAKDLEAAKASHDKAEAADKVKSDAEDAKKSKEEKKDDVKMDPEQIKANMESIKQLSTQVRDLIAHKDWMSINDLLMEISNIPLPNEETKKKVKAVETLKKELEEAKNPPPEKKDEKKDAKKEEKKG